MNRRVSPRFSAGLPQASEHDAWRPSPPERLLLERAGCDRAAGGCLEFRQRTVGGASRPPAASRLLA
jgi:hypothetical protein